MGTAADESRGRSSLPYLSHNVPRERVRPSWDISLVLKSHYERKTVLLKRRESGLG